MNLTHLVQILAVALCLVHVRSDEICGFGWDLLQHIVLDFTWRHDGSSIEIHSQRILWIYREYLKLTGTIVSDYFSSREAKAKSHWHVTTESWSTANDNRTVNESRFWYPEDDNWHWLKCEWIFKSQFAGWSMEISILVESLKSFR